MIVTGIRGLERYEPRGKSTADYLADAGWLLGADVPLIVFTEPAYEATIAAFRPQGAITIWRSSDEEIPSDPRLAEGIGRSRYRWNPAKDTPRYFRLMRQKISWLSYGAKLAGAPVTWVDIALRPMSPHFSPACLLDGPERIRVAELSYVPRAVRHDRDLFYADHYWPVAGGVIRGAPSDLDWLDARVEEEWQWCLSNGVAATDEMMVGFVRFQHPNRFDAYYADHPSLVDNWNGVRESRDLILQMALRALDDGSESEARRRFDAIARGVSPR